VAPAVPAAPAAPTAPTATGPTTVPVLPPLEPMRVDYKDVRTLQKLCTSQGKLFSRKRSGNCAKHQRQFRQAAKRARFLALLPYIGR
jgi:ribosomal protein S18